MLPSSRDIMNSSCNNFNNKRMSFTQATYNHQKDTPKHADTHKVNVIIFKVHSIPPNVCHNTSQFEDMRLALIGSCKALGNWDINQRINASKSFKKDVWEATVMLPVFSEFDWAWIVMGTARDDPRRYRDAIRKQDMEKIVYWEQTQFGNRHTRVSDVNGIIHTIWGSSKQLFNSNSCRVSIKTEYKCGESEIMAVTGSGSILGDWNTYKCIFAEEDPPKSGIWSVKLLIQPDVLYHWKWIVVDKVKRECKRWEERDDRLLHTKYDGLDIYAPWNDVSVEQNHSRSLSPNTGLPEELILKYLNGEQSLSCGSPLPMYKQGVGDFFNSSFEMAILPCNYVTVVEKHTDKSTMTGSDEVTQSDKIFVGKAASILGGTTTVLQHPFGLLIPNKSHGIPNKSHGIPNKSHGIPNKPFCPNDL